MAKQSKELAAVQLPRLPVGLHAAGGATGLYLRVAPTGARNWILRVVIGARRRDMGLGGWPDVPLGEARDRARQARRKIEEGIDPIESRRASMTTLRETPSFAECAKRTIEAKRPEWKNAKHADQWTNTLDTYAKPTIGKMPVARSRVGATTRNTVWKGCCVRSRKNAQSSTNPALTLAGWTLPKCDGLRTCRNVTLTGNR
jgi:hypothetical protein